MASLVHCTLSPGMQGANNRRELTFSITHKWSPAGCSPSWAQLRQDFRAIENTVGYPVTDKPLRIFYNSVSEQWAFQCKESDAQSSAPPAKDETIDDEQFWDALSSYGYDQNTYLRNCLIEMYGDCGQVQYARAVFDGTPMLNLHSWNIMINAYAKNGCGKEALHLFHQMQLRYFTPDSYTFVCSLHACASEGVLARGQELHAAIVDGGHIGQIVVGTALVNMYGKCGSPLDAMIVFACMPFRNVVSWNAMITACSENGHCMDALSFFNQMHPNDIKPDPVTYLVVLDACACLGKREEGHKIHGLIINMGYTDALIGTALINMYGKCGSIDDAKNVFGQIPRQTVASCSAMIAACVQNGNIVEGLQVYTQMQLDGIEPDEITFISVLDACSSLGALKEGQELHSVIVKVGCEGHVIVGSALVSMYGKCGSLHDARSLFTHMAQRSLCSWNAIVTACAQNGYGIEALDFVHGMQSDGFEPNHLTLVSGLDACADVAALEEGKLIHAAIVKKGYEGGIVVGTALVNMYGKCGSLHDAGYVFCQMPHRNVLSWNGMVAACAQSGHGKDVPAYLHLMQLDGIKPDQITFLSVLSTLSHTGRVNDGMHYFHSMMQDYGVEHTVEHYLCMIDLLGRAGHLDDAENLINAMPFEKNSLVWLCLLGVCRIHGDIERGTRAASQVFKLEPKNTSCYKLLSNLYAAAGRWNEVQNVREEMKKNGA